MDSDYDVFRKVILFAQETDQKPYWVDKLFWLIGSQYFYKTKNYPAIQKIKVSKSEFLKRLQKLEEV
ncbi:MAG: hypothetical protein CVT99_02255 [Bacteroidetes bacterium HGW-Bacteroidetes-16]|jgi:hypothetical protein|nr:MAG: hypothetical protein CVT99_02255 [Bacteroidetes bacterium HGW-Bacteroidetes-16]